ncbi:MAG: ATP-binding protein [Aulosira sp. DedQUE10]|nr:ATP-binding protein [Aulosira sp. DedQUE10]
MEKLTQKLEIVSLIEKKLKKCPYSLKCAGLFGSFIKKNNFRDIDIFVIVGSKEIVKSSEQWIKENIQPFLKYSLDIKCYDFNDFLAMIENRSSLVFSIAIEIEFIIFSPEIEQVFSKIKKCLFKQIDITNNQIWKVSPNLLENILAKENEAFRGFLVSHLDFIDNHLSEAEKLLRILIPLEEPYTRVACFKQVNNLLSSDDYRQKLNISFDEAIDFANQILNNRTSLDWLKFEDYHRKKTNFLKFENYNSKDLCLDLVEILKTLPPNMWNSVEILFRGLTQDYNNYVRQSIANFIHTKILPVNSSLGYNLLINCFNFESNPLIIREISYNPLFNKDNLNQENIILLMQGYIEAQSDSLEINLDIENLCQQIHEKLTINNQVISSELIEISNEISKLEFKIKQFNNSHSLYLLTILKNLKAWVYKSILKVIFLKGILNIKQLLIILKEVPESISLTNLLEIAKKLDRIPLDSPEYGTYVIQLYKSVKETQSQIYPDILRESLIDLILKNLLSFLEQSIRNIKWHRFFSVIPKPRFGFQQNKPQVLKFVITNLTNTTIPDIHLEIQSSAEIEIKTFPTYKTYKPGEQDELICYVKPLVAKQIAISYKINGDFGQPIYVSADRANPFVPNKPAFSAHFVGREMELQHIREEIYQQHFLLFGPRRIGKTSVLYQLKEELTEGYLPIYISLQKFDLIDGSLLFDELIKNIICDLAALKNFAIQDMETIDEKIRKIKDNLENERLLLLIDEMDVGQEIKNFSVFLERMRAMMQQESSIRVVFSSGPFITKDLVNPKSPLFNMVKHISLNRLTSEASEKLLRLAEDQDIIFEKGIIEQCIQWTGNLPLYLQILGDNIYHNLKDKDISNRTVSQNILHNIKDIMKCDTVEWDRMWNTLNSLEKAILAFHAHNKELADVSQIKNNVEQISGKDFSFIHIREALKNLVWYGFLENQEGKYKITAGLIKEWVINCLYYPEEVQEFFAN